MIALNPARGPQLLGVVALVAVASVGCDRHDRDEDRVRPSSGASDRSPAATSGLCSDPEVQVGQDGATVVRLVEAAARDEGLTSILYRVTRGDDVIAHGAVGESMAGVPAATTMHFRNGNVAFAYMGTLLLLMAEAGEVDLDDPISRWLPDLDVPSADEVTLGMLVRNTSGYPDYVRDEAFQEEFLGQPFKDFTPEDLLAFAFSKPVWYPPGTSWSYSHTNYVILGEALAAAGDKPLGDLLTERVIEPMGLESTSPALSPAVPGPVLHSYSGERGVFEDTTFWNPSWQTAPGSVLTTTICDLAASAAAIGSGAVLSDAAFTEMLDPTVVSLEPAPDCPETVCRAWTDDYYYGVGVLVQDGWIIQRPLFGGAGALHAYLPDEDLAVALVAITGPDTEIGVNHAEPIWKAIAAELSPGHAPD